MRSLILIVGVALALSACGKKDQNAETQNVGENFTAADIVTNDVTAIDAVTGDAANMAADVNYTETDNLVGNAGNTAKPAARRPTGKTATSRASDEPAANTTAPSNSTTE
jgi:hypothetical protein